MLWLPEGGEKIVRKDEIGIIDSVYGSDPIYGGSFVHW